MQTCHRRRSSCPNFNVWHRPMPPAIVSPGAAPLRSSGGGRDLAIFSGGPRSSMWVNSTWSCVTARPASHRPAFWSTPGGAERAALFPLSHPTASGWRTSATTLQKVSIFGGRW